MKVTDKKEPKLLALAHLIQNKPYTMVKHLSVIINLIIWSEPLGETQLIVKSIKYTRKIVNYLLVSLKQINNCVFCSRVELFDLVRTKKNI